MISPKILIIEDDATIQTILELALKGAGYTDVRCEARGDAGLTSVVREKPDLVLLDVMLPGLDGLSVARRIRASEELAATRIIMLTARTEPEDIVRGLEAGADDYVTKPFDRLVLLARMKAVLRRGLPVTEGMVFDGLRLDSVGRRVTLDGQEVDLTSGEFDLLSSLLAHRGRIFVRGADARSVDVLVARLRQKLGAWSAHVETVRGIGYRLSGCES